MAIHSPESQCAMILSYMQDGMHITQAFATSKIGCTRLAARINDLRKDGHDIKRRMIPVLNRDKKTVRVAQYWMEVK